MKKCRRIHILFLSALPLLFACAAYAQSETVDVVAVTADEAARGAAIVIDGKPVFVEAPAGSGDHFTVPVPDSARELQVTVVPTPTHGEPQNVVLPVYIEDKALARGVTLNLTTPAGHAVQVPIAPRRVFLSIPFTIPLTQDIHPEFAQPNADQIIIQVVPKITKKAQVNIDNTANDGLVADIRYEGIAYLRLKDLMNRTNRRDMDGTFFIGRDPTRRWHIITENLFEKFDKRNLGVARDQRLSNQLLSHLRLDHIDNADDLHFGANLIYHESNKRLLIGNIDRRVQDRVHAELTYGNDENFITTRFEGLELVNPSGRSPAAVKIDRFGYQLGWVRAYEESALTLLFGNLKVEDLEDEGEIDDYTNFILTLTRMFGETRRMTIGRGPHMSGELELDYYGRGSATWLQGALNINVSFLRDYMFMFRLNNDFARITGRPPDDLWENYSVSLMRSRNYFNPHDPLSRWGLESLQIDVRYVRDLKGQPFQREIRFGLSKYLKIMNYDIPLDLYIEMNEAGEYRPGAGISIRGYL